MASNRNLLVLPGDGIGPEVMNEVRKIIAWMGKKRAVGFDIKEDVVGGAALDKHGVPLSDDAMKTALEADAVLFGSVGGPKWDNVEFNKKPERGLLAPAQGDGPLRQPAPGQGVRRADRCQLAQARDRQGPRHHDHPRADRRRLFRRAARHATTLRQRRASRRSTPSATRPARSAASAPSPSSWRASARTRSARRRRPTSCIPACCGARRRPSCTRRSIRTWSSSHMYADALAMQLLRSPNQFDVIVTDNLFGDILSDEASMLTGSLGMLPSASLGAPDATGRRKALYEPIHGSAPDIAGKGLANPLAETLSYAMMLRYSFDLGKEADLVETAVENVLAAGYRTGRPAGRRQDRRREEGRHPGNGRRHRQGTGPAGLISDRRRRHRRPPLRRTSCRPARDRPRRASRSRRDASRPGRSRRAA